jgi:hypothetical protein
MRGRLGWKLTMPARAAPLCPMPGMEPQMSATMLTMLPPFGPACRLQVTLARHQKAAGQVGVATTASQPLALMASSGVMYWPPALFTRPSMSAVGHATTAATVVLDGLSVADVAGVKAGAGRTCPLASTAISAATVLQLAQALRPTSTAWRAQGGQLVGGAAPNAGAASGDDE